MMDRGSILWLVLLGVSITFAPCAAEIIRGIDIDFVTIGNAGNPGDTRDEANPYGAGTVDYEYRIGKYEVTANQWQTINNAAGIGGSGYWSGDQPAAEILWYDALRFCNYLTTGDSEDGVYQFTGGSLTNIMDHQLAGSTFDVAYFLPTEDEWYKAAYYTGSGYSTYANGTDTAPTAGVDTNYDYAIGQPWDVGVGNGTEEQNGTYDMMGNVWEWHETLIGSERGLIGGCYGDPYEDRLRLSSSNRNPCEPTYEDDAVGFRIASVPEPTTLLLLSLGGLFLRKR